MAVAQRVSEKAYEEFVLSGVDGAWELHDGRLVEKPGMSWRRLDIAAHLNHLLRLQLDRADYRVFCEGQVRRPAATIFLPDVMVVPTAYGDEIRDKPTLAILAPLPLVVEVWSPSTGEFDVDAKLPVYQRRGDLEIWRIHPYERTLTRWIRQPDGSYQEELYRGGAVSPAALPGVIIDLDDLLDA